MNERNRLYQVRTYLFALALFMFAGTVVELMAVEHYGSTVQLIPFALCALGAVAVAVVWIKATPVTVLGLRVLMLVTAGGSLFGLYEHLMGNYEFAHELHPRWSTYDLAVATFQGAAPMLAPGTLAIAASVAVAGTFAAISVKSRSVMETSTQERSISRSRQGAFPVQTTNE
jgi:hypothetical protein